MPELLPADFSGIERVLVVTAHPDDVDFGFAGTVATLTDAGIAVSYCIVTDGDAGGSETGIAAGRDGAPAARGADRGRRRGRRARPALPRLSRRPGRDDTRPATRTSRGSIRQVRPQRVVMQSPDAQLGPRSTPAIPITSRSPRPRSRRCIPMRATAGRIRSSRRRAIEPWTVPQVWMGAGGTRRSRTTSTSPPRSSARSRRCCATRASCPTPRPPARWSAGWAKMNADERGAAGGALRRGGPHRPHRLSGREVT